MCEWLIYEISMYIEGDVKKGYQLLRKKESAPPRSENPSYAYAIPHPSSFSSFSNIIYLARDHGHN